MDCSVIPLPLHPGANGKKVSVSGGTASGTMNFTRRVTSGLILLASVVSIDVLENSPTIPQNFPRARVAAVELKLVERGKFSELERRMNKDVAVLLTSIFP